MAKRESISKKVRFTILKRDGYRCRYCGRPSSEIALEIDHVVAVARGGTNDESNLVAACVDCNRGKRTSKVNLVGVSFLSWLLSQAERDDWVGDLARDEIKFPGLDEPTSFKDLSKQIREAGGDRDVIRAAWHAWREYRRGGRPTKRMQAMQQETAPQQIVIVATELKVKLLRVADVQLRRWSTVETGTVWDELYSWLVGVGYVDKELNLHNRVHCGDLLMARLLAAEKTRIRARHKLRGGKLLGALSWSNMGSGPQEVWRGHKLLGDALFVVGEREWKKG